MDPLFDDAFTRPLSLTQSRRGPALDMYQADDDLIVKTLMSSMRTDELQIKIIGGVLRTANKTQ